MTSVLIVDDSGGSELSALLADHGWNVETCAAKVALSSIRARIPDCIIAHGLGESSHRFIAFLKQHLGPEMPAIIVSLTQRSDALRDQCLIAGAQDVAPDGNADDVAARVDVLLNGWMRGTPKRPFVGSVRAQHGRESLTLRSVDIDPSGLGLATTTELPAGELLRVALALPGGSLIAWGRVAEVDGAPGLRFVGVPAEDRVRIASAIKGTSEDRTPRASGPQVRPPVVTPLASAVIAPAPVPAVVSDQPPAPSAVADDAFQDSEGAASAEAPESLEASDQAVQANGTSARAVTQTSSSIADLIGSELGDENGTAEGPSSATYGEGPEQARQPEDSNTPKSPWPVTYYSSEACLPVLRDALMLGLAGEGEGAPQGAVILEFGRQITLPEQRVFDPEPPTSLPEQGLAIRCLVLRLRMFAYCRDAAVALAAGEGPFEPDATLLSALDAEVNAAANELQSATTVFLATGDTNRIKEINQFRNALLKARTDFRSAVMALRGEAVASSRPVLLDVAEVTEEQRRPVTPAQPKEAEKAPEKKLQWGKRLTAEQQRKRRLVVTLIVLVFGLGGAIWAIPEGARRLGPEDLKAIGAVDIVVIADTRKAAVTVPDTWEVSRPQIEKVRVQMAKYKVDTIMVKNVRNIPLAYISPGKEPTILRRGAAPK